MKIYYSIVDAYPAYRVDLAELFGIELRKLGLEVEWFMKRAAAGDAQVGEVEVFKGQRVNQPPAWGRAAGPLGRLLYWAADAAGMLAQLWRKPDAIQCRDKYLVCLIALLVARLRGIPFFYWCSYPFPEHAALMAAEAGGWRGRALAIKARLQFWLLYRVICWHADHVFVQSPQMREDMTRYGIQSKRMTPVPMGVPARMAGWAKQRHVEVVRGRVVYLGSLASARRLGILVDAFVDVLAARPDAELLIVGDGDLPEERHALEGLVGRAGIQSRVRFTGFIPMEQAWALAASAAVCVSPISPTQVLRVASPTKLVEYLALGRPVVCNDHPEQSEIIHSTQAGLCVPWSAGDFAAAIVELLADPERAEAMGRRGPAWVQAQRTYPTIAQRVWAVYQRWGAGS